MNTPRPDVRMVPFKTTGIPFWVNRQQCRRIEVKVPGVFENPGRAVGHIRRVVMTIHHGSGDIDGSYQGLMSPIPPGEHLLGSPTEGAVMLFSTAIKSGWPDVAGCTVSFRTEVTGQNEPHVCSVVLTERGCVEQDQ